MGDHGLRPVQRRPAPARRAGDGPVRSPPGVPGRAYAVHGGFAGERPGTVVGGIGGRPCRAGPRGRDAHPRCAVDHRHAPTPASNARWRSAPGARSAAPAPPPASSSAGCSRPGWAGSRSSSSTSPWGSQPASSRCASFPRTRSAAAGRRGLDLTGAVALVGGTDGARLCDRGHRPARLGVCPHVDPRRACGGAAGYVRRRSSAGRAIRWCRRRCGRSARWCPGSG